MSDEDNNEYLIMSYELTCVVFEGYVRILVDGVWPSDDTRGILVDIYDTWAKNRERPLLLDIRDMRDNPNVFSDYETVEHFLRIGFHEIGPIAVLDALDREKANEFFETTAFNRGLNVRFFYNSEQESINWLLTKSGFRK